MSPTVAVLGAINVDLVVKVPELPRPGITVSGGAFSRHHGGKGGNQAVAAARALGDAGTVVMLGSVGEDDLGRDAIDVLRAEGVDVSGVAHATDAPTGVAVIAVDAAGENQIAVAPGANLHLGTGSVLDTLERSNPTLLLLSLEASPDATRGAAEWCRARAVPVVLNPAPVPSCVRDLLGAAAYLTPNEHELEAIGTLPGELVVIETLGAEGAAIRAPGADEIRVAAPAVDVVDTTGAGDCFNGVLAAGLAEGRALGEAVRRAVVAASHSVAVPGARDGMPTREEIERAVLPT